MQWNTKPIKNTDDIGFTGRFNGVDFKFEVGQTRNLPSHVSEHLAEQLALMLKRKDKEELTLETYIAKILGEEIKTAEERVVLTFKEQVERHENEFTDWQEKQEKEQIIKKDKALNIAKKDVRNIIDKSEKGERADDSQDDSRPESESGQVLGRVSPSPTREKVGVGGGSERTGGQEEQGGKRG